MVQQNLLILHFIEHTLEYRDEDDYWDEDEEEEEIGDAALQDQEYGKIHCYCVICKYIYIRGMDLAVL